MDCKVQTMRATLATSVLLTLSAPIWAESQQPGAHFITSWDMNGDGAVSLEDIKTRRADVFAAFDSDENGVLDADEYVFFDEARANDMKANGGHGAGSGMRRASDGMTLAFNDADANGGVSREEFLAASQGWFTLLDRNADGSVTFADFARQ